MILLTCNCGAALRAPGNASSSDGVCPRCGHVLPLPVSAASVAAATSAGEGGPIMLSLDTRFDSPATTSDSPLLHKLKGHRGPVRAAAFTRDGRYLATVGGAEATDSAKAKQGEICLWNVAKGTPITSRHGHKETVLSVVFSADGETLFTGGKDGTIGVWDASPGIDQELVGIRANTLKGHKSGVTSLAMSPDGATLVSGSEDRTMRFWSAPDWHCQETLRTHRGGACDVAFSPAGDALAACWRSIGPVMIWDPATREVKQRLSERADDDADDLGLAFTHGGQRIAVLTKGEVQVWDLESLQISVSCEAAGRHSLAACGTKQLLAVGGHDLSTKYDVQLSQADSGAQVARWKRHHMAVLGLAFSPDGATLASCGRDGLACLWRVP